MALWGETVDDLTRGAASLRRGRYGVIEAAEGRFLRVRLRAFPKLVWLPEVLWLGPRRHGRAPGDHCLVYYNQPRRFPNYLAVTYVVSARGTTLATWHRAREVLDEIARLKGTDALLCDAANWRLSPEILARFGWSPHCPSRWHRHYIRRFYGAYPPQPGWVAEPVCRAVDSRLTG
jgi:hypothetical protein